MDPTAPFRTRPAESESSATERARAAGKRGSRLEQHTLLVRSDPQPQSHAEPGPARWPAGTEQRDALEFHRGLDVQVLSDSAYDRLFAALDPTAS